MTVDPKQAEENAAKVSKFQSMMDADDAKEAEKIVAAKRFDIKEVVAKTNAVLEVTDAVLGVISYGRLSAEEVWEVSAIADDKDRSVAFIWKMLHKVDQSITKEDLKKMPFEDFARLSTALNSEVTRFLPKITLPTVPTSKK